MPPIHFCCMVFNQNVHYSAHKSLHLVPVLSLMNLVHNLISYFLNMEFNFVLPFMPRSAKFSSLQAYGLKM
jgi:hypothetical protein